MRKRRIADVILMICLLFAVGGAERINPDAFQADMRKEDLPAELGHTTAAEASESEDIREAAWEAARLLRQAGELAEMAEEQARAMKVYEYLLAEYISERKERDEREEQKHAGMAEELLMQEETFRQNVLAKVEKPEESILLFDYDDYDGDGRFEAFAIVGEAFNSYGELFYSGTLYFAGADGCITELDESFGIYRMINGKMEFPSGRKYLYFYTDLVFTANETELWTVRDGKPVNESELFHGYQVVYRGENERNEFEVWVDAYDMTCEKGGFSSGEDMWTGHTYKPYFWYYDSDADQIRKYGGKSISKEDFAKLSGTNIPEEIEAEGYTVGEIIRWDNDIVTINYHYETLWEDGEPSGFIHYDNVIWDNNVKDFWQKEAMYADSWETAGVGGSYGL